MYVYVLNLFLKKKSELANLCSAPSVNLGNILSLSAKKPLSRVLKDWSADPTLLKSCPACFKEADHVSSDSGKTFARKPVKKDS